MNPIAILGGSFLFWIMARGRFQGYANLVNKSEAERVDPSTASASGSAASTESPLVEVADTLAAFSRGVWDRLKV